MPAVFVEAQELLGRVHTEELLSVITFNAEGKMRYAGL